MIHQSEMSQSSMIYIKRYNHVTHDIIHQSEMSQSSMIYIKRYNNVTYDITIQQSEMPQSPMVYIKRYKPSKEELYRYESESDVSLSEDEEWVGYILKRGISSFHQLISINYQ